MTDESPHTPTLERIRVHPVKALDAESASARTLTTYGALAGDREFAMVDENGDFVNGKRYPAVHSLRSDFDFEARTLTVSRPDADARTFRVDDDADRAALSEWLSAHFGEPISLVHEREGGYPDSSTSSGPTIISTATIREVASWFPGLDEENVRRRFRANLEIGGVPAFWEDRLFADARDEVVAFDLGEARLYGTKPVPRCVVPTRDPDTGEVYEGFRETFLRKREATLPAWSGGEWFDHYFHLMVITDVAEADWGATLSVGDELSLVGTRSADAIDSPTPPESGRSLT